ncbi:hypothetical protein KC675_01995 [Candidatus Dojkabacteria bacterium]|jgi:hypothetical protein|uniref:Nucleoside 2-deoxyribosyltransferase n=1 Tax=Candidatus Dojkabacteria bacterium TaxID=2099670 RepID=A0A955I6F1_9BACT|nr:hypothetical protein [Candidatus Dojkabacteria bacterium]
MKIFYTSSSEFLKEESKLYKSGLKFLKNQGLKVQDYVNTNLEKFHNNPISEDVYSIAAKEQNDAIKNSDIIIADITHSSGAIGFYIAMSLNNKKPVLVLRKKDKNVERTPGPIIGYKSRLLTFKEYENEAERNKALQDFVNKSKQKLDSKFILIISSEIDRYLEWASQENRMHKAQIVRDAIEKVMNKDTEYKRILEIDK